MQLHHEASLCTICVFFLSPYSVLNRILRPTLTRLYGYHSLSLAMPHSSPRTPCPTCIDTRLYIRTDTHTHKHTNINCNCGIFPLWKGSRYSSFPLIVYHVRSETHTCYIHFVLYEYTHHSFSASEFSEMILFTRRLVMGKDEGVLPLSLSLFLTLLNIDHYG